MLTYQGMYEHCQKLSQDYTTASKAFFKSAINIGKNVLESELGIYFLEDTSTDATVAATRSYTLPARCIRLKTVQIAVGGRTYNLEPVYNEDEWNALLAAYPSSSSDYAQKFFAKRKTFEIYPTPASNSNVITLVFDSGSPDLSADDYVTGAILTATLASKAIVGTGTTFTSAMVGRVLKITSFPQEYDIASYTSATQITLAQPYEGISIASGSEPFIIGEVMRTPESTHIIPCYYALWQYYLGMKQSSSKAAPWKTLYEQNMQTAKETYGKRYSSKYIPPNRNQRRATALMNPNDYPPALT